MSETPVLNRKARRAAAKKNGRNTKTKMAWVASKNLRPGDKVITRDGRIATVNAINQASGLRTVHNFSVEDHHTYFVGEKEGVWVHNLYNGEDGDGSNASGPDNSSPTDQSKSPLKKADAFTTLKEKQVVKLRQAKVAEDRIQDIDDLMTSRSTSGDKSPSTKNNKDILRALGYDKKQANTINGLGKDVRRALIDSSPKMIAVRAAVTAPGVKRTGNTVTGLSLTEGQYILATLDGLWDGLSPNSKNADKTIKNLNSNNDVKTAEKNYVPPKVVKGEVKAGKDLLEFVDGISEVTADITPSKNEEFIAVGKNSNGELVVRSIAVIGNNGATLPPALFAINDLQAVIHTHSKKYGPVVGNLDHSTVDKYNVPSFVISAEFNRTTEVGRVLNSTTNKLENMFREVLPGGTTSTWYPYTQDPFKNGKLLGITVKP